MCIEYAVKNEWENLSGYKVFAEIDGKLYSPFANSHADGGKNYAKTISKPNFEIGEWITCDRENGFYVFADKSMGESVLKKHCGLDLLDFDNLVLYEVECNTILDVGLWGSRYWHQSTCGITFCTYRLLLKKEIDRVSGELYKEYNKITDWSCVIR